MKFSKEIAPEYGQKLPDLRAEKSVESCHVSGCHGFSVPRRVSSLRESRDVIARKHQALLDEAIWPYQLAVLAWDSWQGSGKRFLRQREPKGCLK